MSKENHQLDSPGLPKVIHWKALMLSCYLLSSQLRYPKWVKESKIMKKACVGRYVWQLREYAYVLERAIL